MDVRVIQLLLLIFYVNKIQTCYYTEDYGELEPEVTNVEVGHNLIFDCKIKEKYVNESQIDVENVFFTRTSSGSDIKIDQKYVQIVDPYTVQLNISNVSLEHNGRYSCMFFTSNSHRENETICQSDAFVGFKPLPVNDFKCIYYYRQKLSCSWTKPNNPVETVYSLSHYHGGWEDMEQPCGNESVENEIYQYCYWDSLHEITLHNDKYFLLLFGNNSLGEFEQSFVMNMTSIVKLPMPKNFVFLPSRSTLRWNAPNQVRLDETLKHLLHYRIYVIDDNDTIIQKIDRVDQENVIEYELDGLKPFTRYRFNISCKCDDPSNNHWSDMVSIQAITEAKAPFISPNIINQSFEVIPSSDSGRRVTIYWKSVPKENQNGPDFEYLISYTDQWNDNNWIDNIVTYPNITLNLKSDVAYLFKIYSKNIMGLSSKYSSFVLPSNDRILRKNYSELINKIKVIMFEHKQYEVQWTSPLTNIIDYTLFWCTSFNDKCVGEINWETKKQNQEILDFSHEKSFISEKKFGVAFNSQQETTGIIWATCFVNMLAKKIDSIFFHVKEIQTNSIKVQWELGCEAQRELIHEFQIRYCHKEYCKNVFANNHSNDYQIIGLKPYTEYNISLKLHPDGLYLKPLTQTVKTHLKGLPKPTKFAVSLENDTDFLLKWMAPEFSSNIDQYKIYLQGMLFEVDNKSCFDRMCNYTITGMTNLKPYTEYTFILKACNKRKEICSNEVQNHYRTKPSYPGLMFPPTVTPVNEKLRVSLKHPKEANGPINAYNIRIYQGSNIFMEKSYPGNLTNIDIDFDSCKLMKTKEKYYISVKASNYILNESVELSGNYTEPMQIQANQLFCPSLSYLNQMLIFSILGIICFVIILFIVMHYSYRMFKSIKQKNEDFNLTIAMESQSCLDQFNNKTSNRDSVDVNNISESSLIESDSANANTNNSSNTINEQTIFSDDLTSNMADNNNRLHHQNASRNHNNNRNNKKHYIKDISHPFCSSDSGVSDVNHHDNLEYFWHQDDSREPLMKKNHIHNNHSPATIINNGHQYKSSTSAPNSSLPSPEHQNGGPAVAGLAHRTTAPATSTTSNHNHHSLLNNNANNTTKQAYVLIPTLSSTNHQTTKYLPHSHTTHLPDSYNLNQV